MRHGVLSNRLTEPGRPRLGRIRRGGGQLLSLVLVLLAAGLVYWESSAPTGTFALFSAGTSNGGSFAAVALYGPTSITSVAAAGTGATVTFPAASPNNSGNGNGYAISGVNIQPPGGAPSCASQAYPASSFRLAVAPGGPTVTATDALSGLAGGSTVQNFAGSWSCFQVQTGYSTVAPASWTQVPGLSGAGTQGWYSTQTAPTAGTQIGFFSDSAKGPGDYWLLPAIGSFTVPGNGGNHTLAVGDVFSFTYSAATSQPTFSGPLCLSRAGPRIYLGDAEGTCATAELGTLSGGTLKFGGGADAYSVSWAWASPTVLKATVTSTNGNGDQLRGTWGTYTGNTVNSKFPLVSGRTITLHYNQATAKPAFPGTDGVCFTTNGIGGATTLYLAHTGGCSGATADDVGFLVGGNSTLAGVSRQMTAGYAWSPDGQTLTITLTNATTNVDLGGPWHFEPNAATAGAVTSSVGSVSVCSPPSTGQLATQSCWPTNT